MFEIFHNKTFSKLNVVTIDLSELGGKDFLQMTQNTETIKEMLGAIAM